MKSDCKLLLSSYLNIYWAFLEDDRGQHLTSRLAKDMSSVYALKNSVCLTCTLLDYGLPEGSEAESDRNLPWQTLGNASSSLWSKWQMILDWRHGDCSGHRRQYSKERDPKIKYSPRAERKCRARSGALHLEVRVQFDFWLEYRIQSIDLYTGKAEWRPCGKRKSRPWSMCYNLVI